VAANPRMALSELRKLAAYINFEGTITQKDVVEMVPIFGEGDFFELTNIFYAGNINGALAALRRHFFTNKMLPHAP
jgi:DNA polymerase III delta subunit